MKFTVFTFIASLCLVAVTANAVGSFETNCEDVQLYEYIAQDLAEEIMDVEPQGIFTGIYFVIKKTLKTLKGIGCAVDEVLKIQVAGHKFLVDITACGGEVNKKVQNLINAVKDIVETAKAIGGISEDVCDNTQGGKTSRGVVSSVKVGHKCAANMLMKLVRISRQIHRALRLIYQIKNVPGDTSKCVLDAIDTLENYFTQFPANIKICSKLPSN